MFLYPPASTKLIGGILVSPCPSVRPSVSPSLRLSVCGQNRVRSVSSTILIGSISYLHILLSNLRRCVACNARFKIQKFVFFWLGIQYDSMVWVIMRRRGVSSERRRSSCSSLNWCWVNVWFLGILFSEFELTLWMLNFSEGTKTQIYILGHCSTLTWHR